MQVISSYCRHVADVAAALDQQQLFDRADVVLSVGGGAFFDLVVDVLKTATLPRSHAHRGDPLRKLRLTRQRAVRAHRRFAQPGSAHTIRPALEIWGRILSRPEKGLAFADFGRRDVPFDQGLPVVSQSAAMTDGASAQPTASPSPGSTTSTPTSPYPPTIPSSRATGSGAASPIRAPHSTSGGTSRWSTTSTSSPAPSRRTSEPPDTS